MISNCIHIVKYYFRVIHRKFVNRPSAERECDPLRDGQKNTPVTLLPQGFSGETLNYHSPEPSLLLKALSMVSFKPSSAVANSSPKPLTASNRKTTSAIGVQIVAESQRTHIRTSRISCQTGSSSRLTRCANWVVRSCFIHSKGACVSSLSTTLTE